MVALLDEGDVAFWRRTATSRSSGCRARATARPIINAEQGCPPMSGRGSPPSSRPRPGPPAGTSGVSGASWTPYDGHANPLSLLMRCTTALPKTGGRYLPEQHCVRGKAAPGDLRIQLGGRLHHYRLPAAAATKTGNRRSRHGPARQRVDHRVRQRTGRRYARDSATQKSVPPL